MQPRADVGAHKTANKRSLVGVRPSSRTGGEPTIDQGAGPCRSKAMARHRIHSLAFKKQVVQEYAAGATLNALAREHDLSRRSTRRFAHGRLPRAACITATAVRGKRPFSHQYRTLTPGWLPKRS